MPHHHLSVSSLHYYVVFASIFIAAFLFSRIFRKKASALKNDESIVDGYAQNAVNKKIVDTGERAMYKKLFHELHHLESNSEILPRARDQLILQLAEAVETERRNPGSILSIAEYSKINILAFIQQQEELTGHEWDAYLARRKGGGKPELFSNRDTARTWLREFAPLKLVDGAWLGHTHRVTTPFALRHITKDAWQVMAEEYGDGILAQHHVHLYSKLLHDVDAGLPEAHDPDFIHTRHGMDNVQVWKGAVAQLLVSLFPHEFLPEILGFNLHFELLTLNTMIASKELEEVKLDAYYFFLHISIDNSHSGHTAMAAETVCKYMDHVQRSEGDEAARSAWRRVQAGYCLSSSFSAPQAGTYSAPSHGCQLSTLNAHRPEEDFEQDTNEWDQKILQLMQAKAQAAGKIHCGSQIKIGRDANNQLNQLCSS
ncbi:hypothetical protein EJ02DRAFT_437123 [Clathrospora elynae]|uniref:Heme oxygenase-like protein n=1 Tax=Clathrospora elynae TaxID=706981 RepID=A0A6A5SEY7_9PLEO|nr:hypothetical protein EJ02DRAFT_437123 [Clathrospora elynae]